MNSSTAQAQAIVDELVRGGVREAVLCPGSRNAPLSFALYAADRAGVLRLHVRVDERSAGFLAVGLARAGGAPVVVVTTSGTAVANLHPAVLEASHSRVPMLVVSADRPPELIGSGANQTVQQHGLFGPAVRLSLTLNPAEQSPWPNARWRVAVCRALAAATGARDGNPGPVQLNVAFREPLMPEQAECPGEMSGRADGGPWSRVLAVEVDAPLELDLSVPTLVVAGDGARVHPELEGVATVAEPSAPAPQLSVHPLAVRMFRPEQVVVTGRPTLHRPVQQLLAADDVAVHVIADGTVWTDVAATARSVGTRLVATGQPAGEWVRGWLRASREVQARVSSVLAEGPPTGLHVARVVADSLAEGDLLVLGSSNPVRDASYVGLPKAGVRVLANRGVAGIDGTVSTAIGAALAHGSSGGGRSIALMGDLTFLHDSGGLLVGPDEPRPDLTIVVANDDGGGIFALLEQGAPEHSAAFERVFGTAHGTDLGALCAAHGVEHRQLDVEALGAQLAQPPVGVRVLEVLTQRSGLRELHARLRA
ncbi:MAG: 2-succinyl-5-enolpyruvyl-6-hydroxy-3-cyclohexene-1-carboxylic-acid synthase [Mycobacteriaceae bacterium]